MQKQAVRRAVALFLVAGAITSGTHTPASAQAGLPLDDPSATVLALQCDGPPHLAQYRGELDEEQGGRTPDEAVTRFPRGPGRPLPRTGFEAERSTADRVLYAYRAADRVRAAMVVAPRADRYDSGEVWGVESYAQCDPSEFDPRDEDDSAMGIWSTSSGQRLSSNVVQTHPLPSHCWPGASILLFGRLGALAFLRDPGRTVEPQGVRGTYEANVRRPASAVALGLHRRDTDLWLASDGESVYAVRPHMVERWPRIDPGSGHGCG